VRCFVSAYKDWLYVWSPRSKHGWLVVSMGAVVSAAEPLPLAAAVRRVMEIVAGAVPLPDPCSLYWVCHWLGRGGSAAIIDSPKLIGYALLLPHAGIGAPGFDSAMVWMV
jgi:hypothetical protein